MSKMGTTRRMLFLSVFLVVSAAWFGRSEELDREDKSNPHRDPSRCEVCKLVAQELQDTMAETGRKKEVLQIGHQFDKQKKAVSYHKSELRLIEALESVCERILQYNIHAERSSSLRFAKGQSETMKTLRGLQEKGVKVDLGMPEDLWEKPSASVSRMKQQCEQLIEDQEDAIGNWFFKTDQESSLVDYLCMQRVLKKEDQACLSEVWTGKEKVDAEAQPSETLGDETAPGSGASEPDTATTATTTAPPTAKQGKAKTTKKPRNRKKVKAGKRGKGKISKSKVKVAGKSSNVKKRKKDEL